MIIGSHVSFKSDQLLGSVKEAISYGANTFMFYTGAPQNTLRSPINDNYTKEAKKLMEENNIDISNVICHAPYIINLADYEGRGATVKGYYLYTSTSGETKYFNIMVTSIEIESHF